jgi:diguanylate cyclase (GGDEF)-like protein
VWLLVGIPGFWIAAAAGMLYAPERLFLPFATEIAVSILCAVSVDILNAYGLLDKLRMFLRFRTRRAANGTSTAVKTVRVPIRRVLLHASYAPLLAGVSLYLLLSGIAGERRILQTAETMLTNTEQGMRNIVNTWSERDRLTLRLGGAVEQFRLRRVYESLDINIHGAMVLYSAEGDIAQLVVSGPAAVNDPTAVNAPIQSGRTGVTPDPLNDLRAFQPDNMYAFPLGNGVEMLSVTRETGGMPRFWQSALFSRTFSLEGQQVALLLPIQVLDAFLDQQVQLMLTAGPFVLLTLLLLIIVSRKLETSLNHLADGTTELLRNLHQGGQPDIPKSGILEVDALAENFLFMNRTLEDLFGELQTVNDDLVIQSEQLRKSESELFRLAHFDVLTQLPNRQYLRVQAFRIQEELSRQQDSGRFSLLLVDLDKFKPINDRYGHAVGDMLLQEVGQVFRHVVGDEVDTGDFSARLGGDEFVSVLRHKTREQVRAIADALIKALSTPFKVAGVEATIACSVGVSHYPEDGQEFSVLLRRADLAMYQAKARGGNCWAEYTMPVGQRDGGDPDEKKSWMR